MWLCGMLLSTYSVSAQDVIVLNNQSADEIEAKVVEVSDTQIKYKKWSYQDGPTFTLDTSEIFVIKYQNGEKQRFVESVEPQPAYTPKVNRNENPQVNYGQKAEKYVQQKRPKVFEPGFDGGSYLGYQMGLEGGGDALTLEVVLGYRFNPYLYVGGTTGAWYSFDSEVVIIPIQATFRGFVSGSQKFTAYAEIGLGGAIATEGESQFLLSVGPGFEIADSISIGFLYNYIPDTDGAMSFRLGFVF